SCDRVTTCEQLDSALGPHAALLGFCSSYQSRAAQHRQFRRMAGEVPMDDERFHRCRLGVVIKDTAHDVQKRRLARPAGPVHESERRLTDVSGQAVATPALQEVL